MSDNRDCTCHPDEAPVPCQRQYAFTECEILRLRTENERLQKYEKLVIYIANDYWELSHDKIKWLYTEYKNKCRKLIEEDHE